MNKREKKKKKEGVALSFIVKNGLEIVEKNFTGRNGEIDIVALDGNTLVFVEVKYRKNKNSGFAEEAVSKIKMRRIFLASMEYIKKKKIKESMAMRFDVIAINGEDINWIKNSFRGDEIGF